ncbi:MAG: hypothetical protein V4584_17695 [Verrucomicrobiota bacterium]
MKPAPSLLIPVLAGLLGGFLGGRQLVAPSLETPRVSPVARKAAASPSHRSARTDACASPHGHDLKSLLRWWLMEREPGGFDARAQLERMDVTALRSLMADLSASAAGSAGDYRMGYLLAAVAGELFRREGEKALRWADAPDPANGRQKILAAMITAAVTDDPALAKPWFDRYQLEFGKGGSSFIIGAAIRGATSRGAADLIKLKEIFGKHIETGMPDGPLPGDFDFHLFVTHFSSGEPGSRTTMHQWAAKDPEAAWAAAKEVAATDASHGGTYAGVIFTGKAVGGNEKAAIRWLMPKLDELPEESRREVLGSLFMDNWASRAVIADVLAEIPREEDRIIVVDGVLSPGGDVEVAVNALQALGSEDSQVRTLLQSVGHWGFNSLSGDTSRRFIHYYSSLMDELKLSPQAREKVISQFRPRSGSPADR